MECPPGTGLQKTVSGLFGKEKKDHSLWANSLAAAKNLCTQGKGPHPPGGNLPHLGKDLRAVLSCYHSAGSPTMDLPKFYNILLLNLGEGYMGFAFHNYSSNCFYIYILYIFYTLSFI